VNEEFLIWRHDPRSRMRFARTHDADELSKNIYDHVDLYSFSLCSVMSSDRLSINSYQSNSTGLETFYRLDSL
jgi:hypothetical protein